MTFRLLAAVSLALPTLVQAHSAWLLPSATVLPANSWVTVDAAVSNDLFVANHNPLRLDGLSITAPDGSAAAPENLNAGKFRNTFDLNLAQAGTYRLSVLNAGLTASWEVGGETKRWRGKPEAFAKEVPADAANLQVTEMMGRSEAFVTNGAKSSGALKPFGTGLELLAVTHPNDLFAGETAQFKLLLDGRPAAGQKVGLVRGDTRFRNQQDEVEFTADAEGLIRIPLTEPGQYLLTAETRDEKATLKPAKQRRLTYTATLEVLPQ